MPVVAEELEDVRRQVNAARLEKEEAQAELERLRSEFAERVRHFEAELAEARRIRFEMLEIEIRRESEQRHQAINQEVEDARRHADAYREQVHCAGKRLAANTPG